jgi:MFS family permease
MCLLVVGAGNSMLAALLPPLVRRLELPDSSIGWIFSLSALLWVFTSPYWGRLSDRTGRKPIITSGLAAYSVSMGAFAFVVVLGLLGWLEGMALFLGLIFTRAIFGAFGSAASPAAQAYIADRTSVAERTQELAALTAAFALGQALGPALCAAIAAKVGLVIPLVLVAVLAAVAAFAIWRYLPETDKPRASPAQRSDLVESFALARDPRVSAHLIYGFGLSVVTGTLTQVFALFLMDRLDVAGAAGAELSAAGFMVGAITLLATQMAILPRLRLSPRALMAIGAGLIAAGVVVQMLAPSLGALLVSQVIQGLGFGLARPGFTGGASMAVRGDEQGPVAGLVVAMNGAGFIFSPLAGGVAYDELGMAAPLVISLLILAAMLVFAMRSRRLRAAPLEAAPATISEL